MVKIKIHFHATNEHGVEVSKCFECVYATNSDCWYIDDAINAVIRYAKIHNFTDLFFENIEVL